MELLEISAIALAIVVIFLTYRAVKELDEKMDPDVERNVEPASDQDRIKMAKAYYRAQALAHVRIAPAGQVYQGDMLDYCRISCDPRPFNSVASTLAHYPVPLN